MILFFIILMFSSAYASGLSDRISYFKKIKPEYRSLNFLSDQQGVILGNEMDALKVCAADYHETAGKIKKYKPKHYIYEFVRSDDERYFLIYIAPNNNAVQKDNLPAYMGGDAFYLYDLKDAKLLYRQLFR